MSEDEKTNGQAARTDKDEKPTEVLVRLNRKELEQCKAETGAEKSATAVAAFVRKSLRGRQG